MQQTLVSDAAAPSEARHLADAFLTEAEVSPGVRRTILLLVSELVTNAVQHGAPPVRLRLRMSRDHVVVEVRDFGQPLPPPALPTSESAGGRGLFIVERLSLRWGARSHPVGKTVWCDVRTSSASSTNSPK